MTGEQFDLLVELMGGTATSPASRAARLVLVESWRPADAGRETGATRQTVHITAKRYSAAHEKVRAAYCVLKS